MLLYPKTKIKRELCAGGTLGDGAYGGLFYWNLNNGVGNSNWNIGARLILCNFYARTTLRSPWRKYYQNQRYVSRRETVRTLIR